MANLPHWVEVALSVVGALYAILTALASVLPRHAKVTHALTRVVGDARGVRKPPAKPVPPLPEPSNEAS